MEELNTFKELGISVLEMPTPPSGKLRDKIRAQNLNVWASLGIQYPTAHTFAKSDSAFTAKVMDRATEFLAAPPVRVLILFEHGALGNSQFEKAAASFFNGLPNRSNAIQQAVTVSSIPPEPGGIADFFIYDIRLRPDNIKSPGIPIHDSIGGYKYSPSDDIRYLLTPFRTVVEQLPQQSAKPLIVESDWLFSMLSRHPQFKRSLHSLTTDTSLAFPVPEESLPVQHSSPLPAIILLLVWGILAYHYHMSPLYRKSLFRYLTAHTFFINDVHHQQLRSSFPGVIIMLQHALLLAAVLFCVSFSAWSPIGLQSFQFHYPELFLFPNAHYNIFILTLVAALLLSAVSILWLSFFHKKIRSVTQIMTLYAWPLQLNFIIGTLAIVVHLSGGSAHLVAALSGVMLVIFGGSFIISSVDASRFLSKERLRYIALTAGIYIAALLALIIWILWFQDFFWQAIDLSLHL